MNESELYKELGVLTKNKDKWEENIPDVYKDYMPVFEKLLHDAEDKVRMEAPEIFRVLGKRKPEFVIPYLEELQRISETDDNRVVRIHCKGAIKATKQEETK